MNYHAMSASWLYQHAFSSNVVFTIAASIVERLLSLFSPDRFVREQQTRQPKQLQGPPRRHMAAVCAWGEPASTLLRLPHTCFDRLQGEAVLKNLVLESRSEPNPNKKGKRSCVPKIWKNVILCDICDISKCNNVTLFHF